MSSKRLYYKLFVDDDLRLFVENVNIMILLLDLLINFTKYIGMKFGESKCAYLQIN